MTTAAHGSSLPARLSAALRLWGLPMAALVVGLCFAPSLPALWHQWWDSGTFNHCLIVIPAAAWLVWEAESRAPVEPAAIVSQGAAVVTGSAESSVFGAASAALSSIWGRWFPHALLFGLATLWLLARLLSVPVVEQGALVAAVPTLAWAVNGNAWARRHRFALLFCLLATPIGEFLVPPLMELTATITVALVRLCGIPVLRDGMLLTLASGDFVVAEACSGIRYLIATVTLGLLFAHLTYRTLRRKLWFMLAAVLAPLLANGLRAWMMVMIAHFTDLQYATGFDHLVYGWVFFGFVIVILFYVGSLFQEAGASSLPQVLIDSPVGASLLATQQSGASSLPQELPQSGASSLPQGHLPQGHVSSFVGASLLAMLLLAWAPFAHWGAMQALASVKGDLPAYVFPQRLGDYAYAGTAAFPTPLEYAGADRIDVAAYRHGEERLFVAAVRYERDRPGHKLVSQSNRPYSFDWHRVSSGTAVAAGAQVRYDDLKPKVRLEDTFEPSMGSATLGADTGPASGLDASPNANVTDGAHPSPPEPWRVYSWYAVAGHTTTSPVKAKLLAVLDWRTPRSAAPPPTVFLVATPPEVALPALTLQQL